MISGESGSPLLRTAKLLQLYANQQQQGDSHQTKGGVAQGEEDQIEGVHGRVCKRVYDCIAVILNDCNIAQEENHPSEDGQILI